MIILVITVSIGGCGLQLTDSDDIDSNRLQPHIVRPGTTHVVQDKKDLVELL